MIERILIEASMDRIPPLVNLEKENRLVAITCSGFLPVHNKIIGFLCYNNLKEKFTQFRNTDTKHEGNFKYNWY